MIKIDTKELKRRLVRAMKEKKTVIADGNFFGEITKINEYSVVISGSRNNESEKSKEEFLIEGLGIQVLDYKYTLRERIVNFLSKLFLR